jgi:hypothetical protein
VEARYIKSISLLVFGAYLGQSADPNIPPTLVDVFGTAYGSNNGVLYGCDVSGGRFGINTANPGQSTLNEATFSEVGGTPDIGGILGAAFIASPEPSSLVSIASALLLLAVGLRRRKNRTT